VSPETQRIVDREVQRIVEEAYGEVTQLLGEHRGRLDALAGALLDRETLDEEDAYRVAHVDRATHRPMEGEPAVHATSAAPPAERPR